MVSAMSSGCGGTPASCTRLDSLVSAAFALLAWIVVTPPGCPVFQAFSKASASAPRTSPIMISVRAKSHRRADQACHVGALSRVKLDQIVSAALYFECVLDDHITFVRVGALDHFIDHRTRKRRLAGAGTSGDYDVKSPVNCVAQSLRVDLVKDTVANVIVECVKHLRRLAHYAAGFSGDWWKEAFEANALYLQFALHDRTARVGYRSE